MLGVEAAHLFEEGDEGAEGTVFFGEDYGGFWVVSAGMREVGLGG